VRPYRPGMYLTIWALRLPNSPITPPHILSSVINNEVFDRFHQLVFNRFGNNFRRETWNYNPSRRITNQDGKHEVRRALTIRSKTSAWSVIGRTVNNVRHPTRAVRATGEKCCVLSRPPKAMCLLPES